MRPVVAWENRLPVASSADLTRILELPRRPLFVDGTERAEALIELMTRRYAVQCISCKCAELGRECITRLRLVQAWALYEIGMYGGLLGIIGVGHGKTLLDVLAPLAVPKCRTALLLVPPSLVSQLVHEYDLIRQHFRVPSLIVHGGAGQLAKRSIVEGSPALHVLSYSRLSVASGTVFIESLEPDTIIADESDLLRHAQAARTIRVLRYLVRKRDTRLLNWSGSITDASVKDYAHLSAFSLKQGSPLPLDPEVVEDWSRALDPSENPAPAGALEAFGANLYAGFQSRLRESPGVVSTNEPSISVELRIGERHAPHLPGVVEEALQDLRAEWVRPDGEELVEALAVARCAIQLACGFYYRWIFPHGEPDELVDEWFTARREWRKEMRIKLRQKREHLDSPKLCALAARRGWAETPYEGDLPVWKAETWPRWREVRGKVRPETQAVRLHPFLAEDAAAWALENRGVVWYAQRAFGEWVAQISGLPLHGGGPEAGTRIRQERGNRSIVASIKAHGRGRDGLQFLFNTQLVANPPSSATGWEQMLGRLHRAGQRAEFVGAEFYRHTPEIADHVDQALRRARYVEGTIGTEQKLTAAR